MYKCPSCFNNFLTVIFLMAHLKLAHNASLSILKCQQENCMRSFLNIHSFKRHLMLKHSNQITNNVSVSPQLHSFYDPNTLCEKNVNSNDMFKNYTNSEDLLSTKACEELINNPSITEEQFYDIVTKNAILFVSKLCSETALSRSLAYEILQHVNNFYKLAIELIKHKYESQENKQNIPSSVVICVQFYKMLLLNSRLNTKHCNILYDVDILLCHNLLILLQHYIQSVQK